MKIRFSPQARADVSAAVEYLVERSPAAAARLSASVLGTIERLAAGEFEGPQQRLTTGETVRSWPVPPLRIYYQRREDEFLVLRVYHQARRPLGRPHRKPTRR